MNNLSGSILGCGWLGLPLAKKLIQKGFLIKGSTTSLEKISILEKSGIEAFQIELSPEKVVGEIGTFIKNATFLIIDIPPGLRNNTEEIENSFVKKIQNCIPSFENSVVKHIIFISSTSVYPDSENFENALTENLELHPTTESAKQLLAVENLLLQNSNFITTVIRFGGLVGENRDMIQFLAGKTNVANPNAPINFIHQDDCVAIIYKILISDVKENKIYNAVAPFHPSRKNYYEQKAKEQNLEMPIFNVNSVSVGKKISSEKLVSDLNYKFLNAEL